MKADHGYSRGTHRYLINFRYFLILFVVARNESRSRVLKRNAPLFNQFPIKIKYSYYRHASQFILLSIYLGYQQACAYFTFSTYPWSCSEGSDNYHLNMHSKVCPVCSISWLLTNICSLCLFYSVRKLFGGRFKLNPLSIGIEITCKQLQNG